MKSNRTEVKSIFQLITEIVLGWTRGLGIVAGILFTLQAHDYWLVENTAAALYMLFMAGVMFTWVLDWIKTPQNKTEQKGETSSGTRSGMA